MLPLFKFIRRYKFLLSISVGGLDLDVYLLKEDLGVPGGIVLAVDGQLVVLNIQ